MGVYFTGDGYFEICTMDHPPSFWLTPKGMRATRAAVKIQRWWRRTPRWIYNNVYTPIFH